MRKKLLRSRSGFEKPESREEAIMQNILGASNVLEPAESNIEEILQSILYSTPYTKEAEFEIEKILLAIKNNGTYDGEVESRDMKILLAILRDLNYIEEPESRIEELFIEWLQQRQQIKVLEGVPPLLFKSNSDSLLNWQISGNTNGVGDKTDNLVPAITDESWVQGWFDAGSIKPATSYKEKTSSFIELPAELQNITVFAPEGFPYTSTAAPWVRLGFFDAAGNYLSQNTASGNVLVQGYYTFNAIPANSAKVELSCRTFGNDFRVMLNVGELKDFEPYGFKIPVICGNATTNIYLDSPLAIEDTISMADTGVEIPTAYGNNVLTVDTTIQPSNFYIEYK